MTDQAQLASLLAQVDLFQDFSKRELRLLIKASDEVDHAAGKEVVGEGRGSTGFHLILSGEAVVSRRGRRLRTLRRGDYFGEIGVIDGQPRSATVTAVTPLHTLSLVVWHFRPLLRSDPRIAYKLLLQLCARLREAEGRSGI
jgi:CRP/FNR family cyclic AMP-dependent transcriptional regulator